MADDSLRKNLPLASPDFDDILASLKEYLREQDELSDYDFDGSTLTILMKLMAYNTHMNAFYMNMTYNEAFLSTAVRRDAVVKLARDIGYVPRSARSATAKVRLTITPQTLVPNYTIPAYTAFSASDGTNTFTFYNTEQVIVYPNAYGQFVADLDIVEGQKLRFQFTVDTDFDNTFTIPNGGVDTRFITVDIAEVGNTTPVPYVPSSTIRNITAASKVFWVFETEGGLHELEFGNDNLGRQLATGDIVTVNYLVSNGPTANGIGKFNVKLANANTAIEVLQVAIGGADLESIESIKFAASKFYTSQNRAVTKDDYASTIKAAYTNAEDIVVWGGETNDPPRYGVVFICIKPVTGMYISDAEKQNIAENILGDFSVLSVTPVITDPDYIHAGLTVNVYFDPTKLADNENLTNIIKNTTKSYFDTQVSKFNKGFLLSVYLRTVDGSNASISNSLATLVLKKRYYPTVYGTPQNIDIDFKTALKDGTIISTQFTYQNIANCYIKQNSQNSAQLDLVRFNVGQQAEQVVVANIGTADLTAGKLTISNLYIQAIPNTVATKDEYNQRFISFNATPVAQDFKTKFDQLLVIDTNDIGVNLTAV